MEEVWHQRIVLFFLIFTLLQLLTCVYIFRKPLFVTALVKLLALIAYFAGYLATLLYMIIYLGHLADDIFSTSSEVIRPPSWYINNICSFTCHLILVMLFRFTDFMPQMIIEHSPIVAMLDFESMPAPAG